MRGLAATGFLMLGVAGVNAQPQDSVVVDVRIGGLVSIQPAGYNGTGGPYLDDSLGGIVPGFNVAVGIWSAGPLVLIVELGSTSSLEAVQNGRFVVGPEPVRATHRDTLLSFIATGTESAHRRAFVIGVMIQAAVISRTTGRTARG